MRPHRKTILRPVVLRDRHRHLRIIAVCSIVCAMWAVTGAVSARAEPQSPSGNDLIRPLPAVVVKATNWMPKFPFPYSKTSNQVTPADIQAEGQMCQWFSAQYDVLNNQIGQLQFNRISPDGTDWNYGVDDLQRQADVVTQNIDQSVDFLTPRAQALTQNQDFAGDNYFPLYEGEAFFGLWQQLVNVGNGIKAHQPDWFTGPSYVRMKRLASEIHRSHVCD